MVPLWMNCDDVSPQDLAKLEENDIFTAIPIFRVALRCRHIDCTSLSEGIYYYIPTNYGLAIVTPKNNKLRPPEFRFISDFAYILKCIFAIHDIVPTEDHVRRPNLPKYLLMGIFFMCRSIHATYMLLSDVGHVTIYIDQIPFNSKNSFVTVRMEVDHSIVSDPGDINVVYGPTKQLFVFDDSEVFTIRGKSKASNGFASIIYTSIPLKSQKDHPDVFYVFPERALDDVLPSSGGGDDVPDILKRMSHPKLSCDVIDNPSDPRAKILITGHKSHFYHGGAHSRVLDHRRGGALDRGDVAVPMSTTHMGNQNDGISTH